MKNKTSSKNDIHREIIRKRKEREREQRIQTILKSAERIFFSKGYARATMDEIAMAAELSKPTIYQYFKTKEDLYLSLVIPVIEELDRGFAGIQDRLIKGRIKSTTQLLRAVFKAYSHCYETSPGGFMVPALLQQTDQVSALGERTRTALSERGKRSFFRGRSVLQLGIEQGLIRKVDVYRLADMLWGLFVGVVQLETIKSRQKKEKDRSAELERLLKPTIRLAEELLAQALAK